MYMMVRFNGDVFLYDRLGKLLPDDIGRDTGIISENNQRKPPMPKSSSKRSPSPVSEDFKSNKMVMTHKHCFDSVGVPSNSVSNNRENTQSEKLEFDMSLAILNCSQNLDFISEEMRRNAQESIIRLQKQIKIRNQAFSNKPVPQRTLQITPDPLVTSLALQPCQQNHCSCQNFVESWENEELCFDCLHSITAHYVTTV
jgi:hypothetical protein